MVTVTAAPAGINNFAFDVDWMQVGRSTGADNAYYIDSYGLIYDFRGSALTYTERGALSGGTITHWEISSAWTGIGAVISDFSVSAATVKSWIDGKGFDLFESHDSFTGSDRDDEIWSGAGADTVVAGGGNDAVLGGAGEDRIFGGDGNDSLLGGADFDDINGNKGNDTAYGGEGNDWVVGGQDNDRLFGENGFDIGAVSLTLTCLRSAF